MKHLIQISLISFLFIPFFVLAQGPSLHVVKKGGEKQVFTLFQKGYNSYQYTHGTNCDTLLCKGIGLERGRIQNRVIKYSYTPGQLKLFNRAMRKAERKIKKKSLGTGTMSFTIQHKTFRVSYAHKQEKEELVLNISMS